LILWACLYTLFFLLSLLWSDGKPMVFMAWAVEIKPSEAASSWAAIRSFSATVNTLFFGYMLRMFRQ